MKKAPDFTLQDQHGNYFNLYENLDKNIMLIFYPKDDSPVCTKQLCNYNDNLDKFIEKGIQPVAINTDNEGSHKNFSGKYNFNFPLLVDNNKEVSNMYNALGLTGMNKRKIVLINKGGNIVYEDSVLPIFYKSSDKLLKDNILRFLKI